MFVKRFLTAAALLALMSSLAIAQTQPPATKSPATTAPATKMAPPPAAAKTATTPVAKKVNLNEATAAELDTLPQIGPARSKAIVDARAKGKFKDWNDFVARKVVPSNAQTAIKDLVSF